MWIWPKRHSAAKVLTLVFLLLVIAAQRNVCSRSPLRAKETVLKYDLLELRTAIDQFTLEHQNPPHSLQDLVESKYLSSLPVDPMTRRSDWVIQSEPVEVVADIFVVGLTDVRSASPK